MAYLRGPQWFRIELIRGTRFGRNRWGIRHIALLRDVRENYCTSRLVSYIGKRPGGRAQLEDPFSPLVTCPLVF